MKSDFVRTARAKGARENRVMYQHALRNAMIPIITMIGGSVGAIIGGNVILENMFGIPGIGQQMVNALNNRDYPLAQGLHGHFCGLCHGRQPCRGHRLQMV